MERNYAELSLPDGQDEADILRELVTAGVLVRSFTTAKASLEEIFIKVYGDENDDSVSPTAQRTSTDADAASQLTGA